MNGLSLCAGVGGLDLALEIAFPEYRCIAAVENNPQAARRFKLRFPEAKIFRDVVGFDGRSLRGILDSIAAGWPCQPHSVAGKRKGTADERWIWDDTRKRRSSRRARRPLIVPRRALTDAAAGRGSTTAAPAASMAVAFQLSAGARTSRTGRPTVTAAALRRRRLQLRSSGAGVLDEAAGS